MFMDQKDTSSTTNPISLRSFKQRAELSNTAVILCRLNVWEKGGFGKFLGSVALGAQTWRPRARAVFSTSSRVR